MFLLAKAYQDTKCVINARLVLVCLCVVCMCASQCSR